MIYASLLAVALMPGRWLWVVLIAVAFLVATIAVGRYVTRAYVRLPRTTPKLAEERPAWTTEPPVIVARSIDGAWTEAWRNERQLRAGSTRKGKRFRATIGTQWAAGLLLVATG
jgi:hypothetical protein